MKKKLIKFSSDIGYNLIYLSVDIFSVSTLVKQLYNIKDFLIWKIGRNNYHYLLYIKNNEVSSYFKFKRSSDDFRNVISIGNDTDISLMHNFLSETLIKNKKFSKINSIYVYQTHNNENLIKKIISNRENNIILIDICNIFANINLTPINTNIKATPYFKNVNNRINSSIKKNVARKP